jgi:predicted CoA-substrate-specific enzyme activase
MILTAGIDVGSTYTKAVIVSEDGAIRGQALRNTGFKLPEVSMQVYEEAVREAGLTAYEVCYIVATGFGRHMVSFSDAQVTDLTASARGASYFFPGTRTILDVGGQTMKATRVDEFSRVKSFRLNDKCAAGTGAFLEKTARYMGYGTSEIGPLVATSKRPVAISGVCAVFAESEVINQLSLGSAPADIMHGAIASLVDRSVQLMKRVRMEPEFTLIGGILRFETMARIVREHLQTEVNVPPANLVQFVNALGAAILARHRLQKLNCAAANDSKTVKSKRQTDCQRQTDGQTR